MNKKAPGKGLLKVVGIIFVVLAAFGIIGTGINMGTLHAMSNGSLDPMMESVFEQTGVTQEMLTVSVVLAAIQSVLYLAAGIVGIVSCNKVGKANICFLFGILLIVWVLGNQAYSAVSAPFGVLNIISMIIGLILPLLYFWGALKNRQAMLDGQDNIIS